jgi:hypothetical protein
MIYIHQLTGVNRKISAANPQFNYSLTRFSRTMVKKKTPKPLGPGAFPICKGFVSIQPPDSFNPRGHPFLVGILPGRRLCATQFSHVRT